MSWEDFYRRREVIDAVLRAASRNPDGPLPFTEVDGAAEAFGDQRQLLLALYYDWMQLMTGYLRAEAAGPEDNHDAPEGRDDSDHADRVARAWRRAAADHATLRAVLDANIDRFPDVGVPALEREQRVLAMTAGLAEPTEPPEEVAKVGSAFLALTRHADSTAAERSSRSAASVLRRLAASA
ncbi:hypothetical protein [Haloechinothrix sp. LS1_15]|uniref:hypothetical protein n=1 Tax=Haloechinothrix sp. LS1_15 TaxID=2652248 RepID=UPI002945980F|nr:hypothetical protein [Haloechinothrix sp. LS1_15]MDV6012733.1 hypothetical protein [Haloechinothrix sp. LS1_15]